MHPEMESFLEGAFQNVKPSSAEIGRVVVEPDYEITPLDRDARHLASELAQCLREHAAIEATALASPGGIDVEIPSTYRLLAKYIRRITLHGDKAEGAWVEVGPPGNWI